MYQRGLKKLQYSVESHLTATNTINTTTTTTSDSHSHSHSHKKSDRIGSRKQEENYLHHRKRSKFESSHTSSATSGSAGIATGTATGWRVFEFFSGIG
jgi:hypothetical protein